MTLLKFFIGFLLSLYLVATLAIVGHFDYEQEQDELALYCDMVKQGYWGAYRTDVTCN